MNKPPRQSWFRTPGIRRSSRRWVQGPSIGAAVTSASLKPPDGVTKDLTSQFVLFSLIGLYSTEAAMEAAYSTGNYAIRFNRTEQPERVVEMAVPTIPAAIPQIVNFAEAQTLDATKEFTLTWKPFTPQRGRARSSD